MPKYDRPRENKGRSNFKSNDSGSSMTFEEYSKNRTSSGRSSSNSRDRRGSNRGFGRTGSRNRGNPDRDSSGFGSDRREFRKTKVTCSSCGAKCEVPFKPTSSKPIYCDDCFGKKDNPRKNSDRDLDVINEKLNKIMKALDIK